MSTTAMSGAPGPAWKVVNVVAGTGQNSSGQWVQGNRVTYEIAGSGVSGTVFVPNGTSPDAASALIDADAQNLHAIRNLTSG